MINVGGTVVRPGDFIIGDDDGVVVVPKSVAAECLEIATERETIEEIISVRFEPITLFSRHVHLVG